MAREDKVIVSSDQKTYIYNRQTPLVFIGGVPRSGTTLMRAMLVSFINHKLLCVKKILN